MSAAIWGKMENPLSRPAHNDCFRESATANITRPNGQMEMYGSPHRKDSSHRGAAEAPAQRLAPRGAGELPAHGAGPEPPDLAARGVREHER